MGNVHILNMIVFYYRSQTQAFKRKKAIFFEIWIIKISLNYELEAYLVHVIYSTDSTKNYLDHRSRVETVPCFLCSSSLYNFRKILLQERILPGFRSHISAAYPNVNLSEATKATHGKWSILIP